MFTTMKLKAAATITNAINTIAASMPTIPRLCFNSLLNGLLIPFQILTLIRTPYSEYLVIMFCTSQKKQTKKMKRGK
jgi:hypothetical protein